MQFVSERITTDENICGGNLTICSGRIAGADGLEFLSASETVEEVIDRCNLKI
jgi:uncharacterized protein (DUF433 family)